MDEELQIRLSDEDLFLRLPNTEDNFVERKRFSDDREWARTSIAFANSCPIGYPGILFIGVYDDGTIERPKVPVNLDSLQKTLGTRLGDVWPPLYFVERVLRKDDHQFLAVLVPGSPQRPHFAGHSYVRVGCETKKASEEQFGKLILQRTSKAREIERMTGKTVVWQMIGRQAGGGQAVVADCNQFYITLRGETYQRCFPVDWVAISFDPDSHRPHLIIQHP